jgi:hypothetical protein
MSLVEAIYFAVGGYFVIDGVVGVLQTRNWVFVTEWMAAWLIAVTLRRLPGDLLVAEIIFFALGAPGVIAVVRMFRAILRRNADVKTLEEYVAIKRHPRSLAQRILFQYTPYADLPDPPAPPST